MTFSSARCSYWEIAIKLSVGKLALNKPYQQFMDDAIRSNSFEVLPIYVSHEDIPAQETIRRSQPARPTQKSRLRA